MDARSRATSRKSPTTYFFISAHAFRINKRAGIKTNLKQVSLSSSSKIVFIQKQEEQIYTFINFLEDHRKMNSEINNFVPQEQLISSSPAETRLPRKRLE